MSNLVFTKEAQKDLIRLPKNENKKILKKFNLLKDYPLSGKLLKGDFAGFYSLRAWPYRIIYTIEKSKTIVIHRVEHRQGVYK